MKLDRAEESTDWLIKGYEGLKRVEQTITPSTRRNRLSDALDRLVELATIQEDAEAMEKWKTELKKIEP